jgi:hypothetical protein
VDARFLPDGRSFGVAVMRPDQGPQISFWKYNGTGIAQQPCSTCGRSNLSSIEPIQSMSPFLASVLFSASGKKVVVAAGNRLIVHDFTSNSIQFQMDFETPMALTDEALVTLGKDKEIHLWSY